MNGANQEKGHRFEDEVAALFRVMGYTVQQNIEICSVEVDILASIQIPGTQHEHRIIVECKDDVRAQNRVVTDSIALLDRARRDGLADSAEIITRNRWGPKAQGVAATEGIGLHTFNEKLCRLIDFSDYIERIIYDFEHFDEHVAADGQLTKVPIIETMSRSDLYRTYVPHICSLMNPKSGTEVFSLDEYVKTWLADPDHNHLSVLGDFGTGKSSFCLHLAYELAKDYRREPTLSRIPLFISLRDYTTAVNLQKHITDLLVNKYNVRMKDYTVFRRFLESERLVLIFDGFDEMATKTDRALTVRNFEELTKTVVPGSKTILTCRTHYFTDQRHMDAILRPGEGNELLILHRRPNFQMVELREFSDDQIQELLRRHHPDNWHAAWTAIKRNLHDLARRPLLLDMIIKSLPQLLSLEKIVNIFRLYDEFTLIWINRDDFRARMTPEDKQAFMAKLAMKMWTDGTATIPYRDIPVRVREHLKNDLITLDDLDAFDYDTRTCAFLNRDPHGNYGFIHQSFMEFFVAKEICELLKEEKSDPRFDEREFTPEVCSFVAQYVSENLAALETACQWAFNKTGTAAWNAINVLAFLKGLRPERAVDHLVGLCKSGRLKSGITWILGELGTNREDLVSLLRDAVRDPTHPGTWWEAAFALEKLGTLEESIVELIRNLPSEWSYEVGVKRLRDSMEVCEGDRINVDQRAVVAIVKEYRKGKRPKDEIRETVKETILPLDLPSDRKGRRSYYSVWLLGELRVTSELDRLFSVVDHPQSPVRNMLAEALGKIGRTEKPRQSSCLGDGGLRVLGRLLNDPYYRTRIHAAEAIGKVGGVSLLPDLKTALDREPLQNVQNAMEKTIQLLENPLA